MNDMKIKDVAKWNSYRENNKSEYGSEIICFAERWAVLMESEMNKGKSLQSCAEETSITADINGITGFMYGCAVQTLFDVWVHGESLAAWHNKTTQINDEGDEATKNGLVLNPALLETRS